MAIKTASRELALPRILMFGPPGSGKTLTALLLARALCPDGKIGVIDTEQGTSQVYAGRLVEGKPLEFDVEADMASFAPEEYEKAIDAFASAKYPVLVIDSISQEWSGPDGILESLEGDGRGNSFGSWKHQTPRHNKFIQKILNYPGIVICTCRAKISYVQEQTENNGRLKTVVRNIGLQPQTRDEALYEFGLVVLMEGNGNVTVTKSRYESLSGFTGYQCDKQIAQAILQDQSGSTVAMKEQLLQQIEATMGKPRFELDKQAEQKGNPPLTKNTVPQLQKILAALSQRGVEEKK